MLSRAGLGILALGIGAILWAQTIRVDTTLVVIPVTVTDPMNRFVLGLDKKDFSIFEDGTEQKITHFSAEDAPLSVGILFDTSGSMDLKTDTSHGAVSEFLKTMNGQDEAFLIQFSDKAEVVQEFTGSTKEIEDRMTIVENRRSDGAAGCCRTGSARNEESEESAQSSGRRVRRRRQQQPLYRDGHQGHREGSGHADLRHGCFRAQFFRGIIGGAGIRSELLAQIADQTGGRAFGASEFSQLPGIAEKIAIELRNQYMLAYSPANSERDGKYRKVEVKMRQPKGLPLLKARWRLGYYAPSE